MLGTELAAKMKEIRPELKVIVITGYSDTFQDILHTKNGISEIIYKPIILSDFSKVIRRVLDDQKN
jgi:DNA-binding NtrC family response regulator